MAEIKITVMGEAQSKRIGRMIDENILPDVGRRYDLTRRPGFGGGKMALFAR